MTQVHRPGLRLVSSHSDAAEISARWRVVAALDGVQDPNEDGRRGQTTTWITSGSCSSGRRGKRAIEESRRKRGLSLERRIEKSHPLLLPLSLTMGSNRPPLPPPPLGSRRSLPPSSSSRLPLHPSSLRAFSHQASSSSPLRAAQRYRTLLSQPHGLLSVAVERSNPLHRPNLIPGDCFPPLFNQSSFSPPRRRRIHRPCPLRHPIASDVPQLPPSIQRQFTR